MIVLIIENERPAADRLKRLLFKIDESIQVAGVLETVEGTINWFQDNAMPDLILMDIQLDDGLCFEIFETIHISTPIIFTTAFDAYMLNAFKVNSVDYLLKPIEEEALSVAINKFKNLHKPFLLQAQLIEDMIGSLSKHYKSRFLIKIGSKFRSVTINEIRYFCVSEKSTFLKTNQDREYPLDFSLDKLQGLLDPSQFFRLNRNCIVSIHAVRDILAYSSSRLKLVIDKESNNDMFVVSRDKVSDFKKWIDR